MSFRSLSSKIPPIKTSAISISDVALGEAVLYEDAAMNDVTSALARAEGHGRK